MRVAFLTHEPFYPPSGGGSAEAVYLVKTWVARGHEVEVYGPALENAAEVESRFGIRLHGFQRWRMGRTTRLRTPKYLAYPRALERWVRAKVAAGARYDVVVAQHSISAVAAGRLQAGLGIPAVFNLLDCLTGFLETWPRYLMPRVMARALVRYELSLPRRYDAAGVMTVSDALKERVVANGFPSDRVRPIYYGYDAGLFRPKWAAESGEPALVGGESDGRPRVVMHGSFDHHHLGRIAVEAVSEVARRRPEVVFRWVGPKTPALEGFLREVRSRVPGFAPEVTGFVAYDRIPEVLAEGRLGITPYEPSTGTHCAFVAKTVEYLAMGLPVVSTPLESAVRYYGGMEAVRFSGADGAGFADHVIEGVTLSREERARRVAVAQRKVAAELDWSVISRNAAEFVESVVAARREPQTAAGRG